MKIAAGDPLSADGLRLIAGSEAILRQFYTKEESFAYSPQELAAPHVTFYIGHIKGRAVGCVAAADMGDYVEVKRLFVEPATQGSGLGRALMEHLEAAAHAQGHRLIRLETGDKLVAAGRLYAALGYTRRGPFADYLDVPTSTFMEKTL